jgi:hypothetical protein
MTEEAEHYIIPHCGRNWFTAKQATSVTVVLLHLGTQGYREGFKQNIALSITYASVLVLFKKNIEHEQVHYVGILNAARIDKQAHTVP